MAELAKSIITVSDESAYGAGTTTIVPLYVFATQSNKTLSSSSGEIAVGTTIANELLVMTSQRDVINTFGIPYFEEINGTVQQSSELNEVGLLGLYSAMGSSALAYALRADVDLSQLKPSSKEPRSKAEDGTKWFDAKSSTFIAFAYNSDEASSIAEFNWKKIDVEVVDDDSKEELKIEDNVIFNVKDLTFEKWDKTTSTWKNDCFIFASNEQTPAAVAGKIWIQTLSGTTGSKLVKKTYNSLIDFWSSSIMDTYDETYEEDEVIEGQNRVVWANPISFKVYTNEEWVDEEKMKHSLEEPTSDPEDGTLWFNDTVSENDIKILINGIKDNKPYWYELTDFSYGDDPQKKCKLYVQADAPTGEINSLSIWIDTNDPAYPKMYRYEGFWKALDNTDNTTLNGVLFADYKYYKYNEDGSKTEVDVDPDLAPKANAYPKYMVLFDTGRSQNNVKKYNAEKSIWETVSGNAEDGSGLFGANAQRKVVVKALNGAIESNEEIKSLEYDFFYACCPGYPEVDVALNALNTAKKEMFYIVSDTPKNLKPTSRAIIDWGKGGNGSHGMEGRTIRTPYMTRQYPPMGITSNVDGTSVAVPTSVVKMKNLLNLPIGQICAGTQYGVITNIGSTGYINDENEYAVVSVNEGLGETIVGQAMNPIMMRRNTGLLFWGENTENDGNTSLSDEHGILTILRLKRELEEAVTPFFFRKNIRATRDDFNYVLKTILSSYVANDEIYDYVLDTDTPNTAETISRKELHAVIALELVKGIEFIYIPISVVNTGTLSEQSLIA